jgi:hypothetical protein
MASFIGNTGIVNRIPGFHATLLADWDVSCQLSESPFSSRFIELLSLLQMKHLVSEKYICLIELEYVFLGYA